MRTVLRTEVSAIHKHTGTTGVNQNHPLKTEKYGHSAQMKCCL